MKRFGTSSCWGSRRAIIRKPVRTFAASYGIEKSAVSDHFVRVSREKLRELLERPLDQLQLCVIYLDGIEFKGQHLVVALGVAVDGGQNGSRATAGSQ